MSSLFAPRPSTAEHARLRGLKPDDHHAANHADRHATGGDDPLVLPWTDFTPTWTAASSNPSLGNGTLVARYTQVGKLVVMNLRLVAGSTTTFGSGVWSFSLPVTAANLSTGAISVGSGIANDATSDDFVLVTRTNASGTAIRAQSEKRSEDIGPTLPFAWASGDVLQLQAIYEAA